MNKIDILELLAKKIEEQTSIIASCSSIINKKAEARERTEYIKIKEFVETLIAENKELKEKNKWKPIKEYNRQKYDWVLVKYFDGNYECVPEVAEQRNDGKWYTSEKQIPFEVKYFFDMQSLLGKE